MTDSSTVTEALTRFREGGSPWLTLPFFRDGSAERVAAAVDARAGAGATVLPAPGNVFRALALTPLDGVRAVILGQDPYPTPGDAHGLAFSYVGKRRLPASLKVILAEMAEETGSAVPASGDLTPWARQGVLLLNAALTVEAGKSGAHMKLGWDALTDGAVAAVSATRPAVAFLLWGAPARRRAELVDRARHLVLEAGHPSPLNRRADFRGSRPFGQANAWLAEKGLEPIDWRLA
ncbi:MAG: uracil-DNA glycosylase [Methylobacterium frigidaeris]